MSIQWLLDKMAEHCNDVAIITTEQITYGDILNQKSIIYDVRGIEYFRLDGLSCHTSAQLLRFADANIPVAITTSGTTGEPKTVYHQISDLIAPYKDKQLVKQRMIFYLMPDHIGGLNTILRSLVSGGTLIVPKDRSVDGVCQAIEDHKAEVLPATPSFLNMLMMSRAYQTFDLHSLKVISFGTEVMPELTMKRLMKLFPKIRWVQIYGTTELGILHTETHPTNPLWIYFPDAKPLVYVNKGTLWVDDTDTGDRVETMVDLGKTWTRILGRNSDIINVGGVKVDPTQVENIFREMKEVDDVVVYGEPNPIMGNIVCAKFNLNHDYTIEYWKKLLSERMQKYPKHYMPMRIIITADPLFSLRGKKVRRD
jgi:long-chain acyl-CoA synthetase